MAYRTRLLIFFIIQQTASTFNVNFEPLGNNPGMVFQQKKNIFFSNEEWKIVYYYDLQQFYVETNTISNIRRTMGKVCESLKNNGTNNSQKVCELTMEQLKTQQESINTRDEIIKSFEHLKRRITRAPIEIIGTAAKYLFGILNTDDAEKYATDINNLQENANYAYDLIQQQTTLIEGTITTQKTTVSELQSHLISVNEHLEEIEKQTSNHFAMLHTIAQFNSLSTTITLAIIHHEELTRKVFNLLTNTLHGKITDIIPPTQLKLNMREIATHLKSNQKLPSNIESESIYTCYKYTEIKSILHEDKVMIEVKIPIINTEPWTFFNTIALPIRKQTDTYIMHTDHKQIFTNNNHNIFIPASTDTLKNCIAVGDQTICKTRGQLASTDKICELTLLNDPNIKEIPSECNIQPIIKKNYVLKVNENQYFLSTQDFYTVRATCNDETKDISIHSDGYLNVATGCTIVSDFFKINTPTTHIKTEFLIVKPAIKLDQFEVTPQQLDSHTKKKNFVIHNLNNEYDGLIAKAHDLKRKQEARTINEQKLQQFNIFAAAIIIIFVIGSVVGVHYAKGTYCNRTASANNQEAATNIEKCDEETGAGPTPTERNKYT